MSKWITWTRAAVLIAALAFATRDSARAQALSDLAGSWHGYSYNTPGGLTLIKNNQNQVTDIPEINDFKYKSYALTFDANGNFSGTKSGTATIPNSGQVVLTIPANSSSNIFHITRSNDVMVSASPGSPDQSLGILLKAPSGNVVAADMAGNWNIVSFQTPTNIILHYDDSGNPGVVTSLDGTGSFHVRTGSMSVDGNGNFSGSLESAFTGSFINYDSGNAQINVQINPTGDSPFTLPLYVNASKDVMIAMQGVLSQNDNHIEMILFIKAPSSSPAATNLKGGWHIDNFDAPSMLIPMTDGGGHVTDIMNADAFGANNSQNFHLGYDGFLTAQFEYPTIGNISLPSAGNLIVAGTDTINESIGASFFMNQGGNFLVAVQSGESNQEIIICTYSPQNTNTYRNFGLLFFHGSVYWAADSSRYLQFSPSITSPSWSNVGESAGSHSFSPATSSGMTFYRVVQ